MNKIKYLISLLLLIFIINCANSQDEKSVGNALLKDSSGTLILRGTETSKYPVNIQGSLHVNNKVQTDTLSMNGQKLILNDILLKPDSIKYVSAKYANDSNRFTFSTIQSAINNSGAGTLIYVYPGLYNEADTGKNGVNIYLSEGAILCYSSNEIPTLVLSGVTCTISGEGLISQWYTSPIVSGSKHAIKITNNSNVTINCNVSNYGLGNENSNGWRFGSTIYVKQSNLIFKDKFIYSKTGTTLGFDSLSTATISNAKIESRGSNTIGIFSRRKIYIKDSYIGLDSNNIFSVMVAIQSDSSKLYLSNCIFDQLDGLNSEQNPSFIFLTNTANRELERLWISNCKFYTSIASPFVSPIQTTPIIIQEGFMTATGTISKSANSDTIKGKGTLFTSELITPPNFIKPFCLESEYYGKIQTVLNDTVALLKVATGTNPPNSLKSVEFYNSKFYYTVYDEEGTYDEVIDTSNYSIISFQGESWFPTQIIAKVKIRGTYSYGPSTKQKSTEIERLYSLTYKNLKIKRINDGILNVDSSNMFMMKLNRNTSITMQGVSAYPTPINLLIYRTDTTSYSLAWSSNVIWQEGIVPPPPSVNMIDVYSFLAINFSDLDINLNKNVYIGTLIKSFPIPY